MRVVSVANQKGGCGKTTTAINLSSSLALRGRRVLLIDLDPQAHATIGLNVQPSDLERSVHHVLTRRGDNGGGVSLEDIKIPIKEGFDLAPSSVVLSAFEQELSGVQGREHRLHEAITSLRTPYDYVLIDCPPSIGLLCVNALRASREVIIPIDMSLFSLRGVAKLLELVLLVRERLGHAIRPRALITMYDFRTRYARQVLEKVQEQFGRDAYGSVVRYNIRLRETVDHGLPIGDYDRHAIGYKDYEALAEEVIRQEANGPQPGQDPSHAARDLLRNAERYVDEAAGATPGVQPPPGREGAIESALRYCEEQGSTDGGEATGDAPFTGAAGTSEPEATHWGCTAPDVEK